MLQMYDASLTKNNIIYVILCMYICTQPANKQETPWTEQPWNHITRTSGNNLSMDGSNTLNKLGKACPAATSHGNGQSPFLDDYPVWLNHMFLWEVGFFYCHVTLPGAFHANIEELNCTMMINHRIAEKNPLTHPNDGGQWGYIKVVWVLLVLEHQD